MSFPSTPCASFKKKFQSATTVSLPVEEESLIITSAIAIGVLGFIATILFLFCIPELDAFFAHDAPQPRSSTHSLLEKVQASSASP